MIEHKIGQLKQFILDKTYKKRYSLDNLDLTLGLEKDLGFDGDDAAEFIFDYGEKFSVDTNNFNSELYFTPEDYFYYWAYKLLPCLNPKKKELTIGDLVAGIKAGRLDDEVIAASRENKEI
ncbi:DUF1493 family protein [Dysgonomonas sp. 521]|uniref:DUF1493 family protein n=1 Tax=Dysgonomonas sp. 521 TaxID=2302932 RepID=UPI0013CFFF35|nr:DUF1493 family protein [Dysgonomonas sp. 521]NDV97545.1 DUF1493 family protein [Dysgonomonas sp. 521]